MIVKKGIIQVPEGRHIFPKLTVQENLEMGAFHRKDKAGIAADVERVYDLFPRMHERRTPLSGTLSGRDQQMRPMGRAMMSRRSMPR